MSFMMLKELNAKAQGRKGAKKEQAIELSLRLRAFAPLR